MDFPLANTFGVRHELFLQTVDDFHRHRHRVNKKINRLRRSLNIITKDTKHYSEKNKTANLTSSDYELNKGFGDVLLLLMDVHSSKSREKFLISKYKKALKHVKNLFEIIVNEKNELVVLEVLVIASLIEGSLAISKKKYEKSLNAFSISRCALQFLYSYQELPPQYTKELYYNIIDFIVDPALKVSASQCNTSRANDLAQLSKEQAFQNKHMFPYLSKAIEIISKTNAAYVTPSDQSELKLLKELQWGSYSATIRSDDLSLAIMKINEEVKGIMDEDSTSYDSSTEEEYDDSEKQEQYIISTYLKYNYLLLRVRRDITILNGLNAAVERLKNVSKNKLLVSWKECLKVNDAIISSLEEVTDLPGIANDDDLMDYINTLKAYFTIKKQLRLSQAYLISNKYIQALALVSNSRSLIENAKPFSSETEGNLPRNEDLENMKEHVLEEESKLSILASHFNDSDDKIIIGSKYIVDNKDKFPALSGDNLLSHVAPTKVDIQPVHVKPVLFDIAYNYIGDSSSNSEQELQHVSSESGGRSNEEGEKKKGFFGLFGR
ncbi:hypothetical protein CAS74_001734 [Pichia kudriavzevii]|uniref:Signal recognition particle subunit SRP68 n=1 Tax=Pichia kudriavzevii TaxID=4909 RepID=A0A1Z8JS65_PICKU|nr:hypothetical protein CAS74_001734 [Pichia kudriavzevii]